MRVKTNEKQIQKLKSKFPNLQIIRVNENIWDIEKTKLTDNEEKEIDIFLKNNETKILEKKEIVMSENPINKPISEITGNLSQAFSSLSSVIMGQATAQVKEIETKILALDTKIKESNQLLSAERLKMVEEQKAITAKHVENLQKVTNELTNQVNQACHKVEKELIELAAKFDEKNRDFSEALEKQKNKLSKLPGALAEALKE